MKFNVLLILLLGMKEAQGRSLQKRQDETPLTGTTDRSNWTLVPLPDNFHMCWSNIPVREPVRTIPPTDIALLVLWGFRALALATFNDRAFLSPFKSSGAPNLEIPISSYNGRQPTIETQIYGMWYCWDNMLKDFRYPVTTVVCNFGGNGPIEESEGKLEYINNNPGRASVEEGDPGSTNLQQSQNTCSRFTMPEGGTSRRDLKAQTNGEIIKREATPPPPIDYSAWENFAANDTDDEDGSNRQPEYYARIGDFSGPQIAPFHAFRAITLVLMHLARTTSAEARTQSIPGEVIRFQNADFNIVYHPRHGAVELPSYEAMIKGMAFIARVWKISDNYRLCQFVLFHGDEPIVDGKIIRR